MNMMNQIILEGNIVKTGEMRTSPTGTKTLNPSIAVKRDYITSDGRKTEEVSFFDLAAFGKLAEVFEKCQKEGDLIRVVGRLKQDRWKNQEGKTQSKINVVCEHVEFIDYSKRKTKEEQQPDKKVEDDSWER